jgi:hypothetical protein
MSKKAEIYQNGEYLGNHPDWHEEDSEWKAKKIAGILTKNNVNPKSICEVGCGAGEILNQLHSTFKGANVTGYEISQDAFEFCSKKQKEGLNFKLEDILNPDNKEHYDVLLCIDVFEHVEDYFSFLRKLREKADYKVFHIPLELSVVGMLSKNRLMNSRRKFGHLHYYSKDTALACLRDTGYTIVDSYYSRRSFEVNSGGFSKKFMNLFRRLFNFNRDLSVRLFGGESLLVIAK